MSRFSAEGLPYFEACQLIAELTSVGIDANISVGCVAIYPKPDQVLLAKQICDRYGASFAPGFSMYQEDVLTRSDSGWDVLERETNNAIAVAQEWL